MSYTEEQFRKEHKDFFEAIEVFTNKFNDYFLKNLRKLEKMEKDDFDNWYIENWLEFYFDLEREIDNKAMFFKTEFRELIRKELNKNIDNVLNKFKNGTYNSKIINDKLEGFFKGE